MTFDRVNRRTHLYLGILLAPWFLLYALSSVVLNHGGWFEGPRGDAPEWTKTFEHAYRLPPITDETDPWDLAAKVLADHNLAGRHRARFDDDGTLVVQRQKFLSFIRLTYYPKQGRIVGEEKRLSPREVLTAAHFRAGYGVPYFLEILWAVFVDLVAVSTLVWIASGIYLWFRLKRFAFWGWVALGAGMASFVAVVLGL